jgi:copper transport protein
MVISIAATLVLLGYRIASAHAMLISSNPSAGSWVPTSPERIRLVFSEPIEASLATLSLVSANGSTTSVPAAGDPHDVHAVIGTPSSLVAGEYRVVWRVVSADGHPVGGSFVFGVGAQTGTVAVPDVAVVPESKVWGPAMFGAPLIPAILRGGGVGCLLAVTGLLWFAVSSKSRAASRLMIFFAAAAPVLLAAHLVTWLINTAPEHRLDPAWISAAFATTPGRVELARTILSIVPLWALGLARRPRIGLAGGVLGLLATSAVGHSAAIVPEWAIPFKAIHLLALAVWAGGLVWIVACASDADNRVREISRVSSAAFWAVFAVAFSGIVQTRVLMASWSDLASVYGTVVLAKSIGLLILIGFGAYHRRLIARLVGDHAAVGILRKSVGREILVFCMVVLLAGFLAYLSPPMEHHDAHSSASSMK